MSIATDTPPPPRATYRRWRVGGVLLLAAAAGLAVWLALTSAKRSEPAAAPAASAGAWVSGRVVLGPAIQSRIGPEDTVFILARLVDGPRMPVAVLRRRGAEWPLQFRLDQSTATNPNLRLPPSMQLVVVARVSRSGQEVPQAGDLQGHSAPVPVGSNGLEIEINETVK